MNKARQRLIEQKKKLDILKQLSLYFSLDEILDFFFKQINEIFTFEGKVLYFLEEDNQNYIKVQHFEFAKEFEKIKEICNHAQYPIQNLKTAQKCLLEKKVIQIKKEEIGQYDEFTKKWVEYWGLKHIIYCPVIKEGQNPIGLFILFNSSQEILPQAIDQINELIELFYNILKRTLKVEKAYLNQKEIEIAKAKYKKLLELAAHVNILTNPFDIYKKLILEMIQVFGFELGFVQIEKDGRLPIVFGTGINEEMELISKNELDYFGKWENAHQLYPIMNPNRGACCICYINNIHFYIYNAESLSKLPMTVKDKKGIDMVGKPIKTFIQIPIKGQERVIGILQLWSMNKNITLSQDDIELMTQVCSFIPSVLNNFVLHSMGENQKNELIEKNKIVQEKNMELIEDLKLARQIQQNLIPKKKPNIPNIEIASLYKPMEEIGGDFYDFHYDPERKNLSIFISDVSGHGVPAALITTMLKTLLQTAGKEKENPSQMLSYINQRITGKTNENFITAFYGIINVETLEFKYARASHNFPYLIRNNETQELESRGKMLGINPDLIFEQKSFQLQRGDKILLYTDGLTETINAEKVQFEEKLPEIMIQQRKAPIQVFTDRIYSELLQFSEKYHFDDDVCMVGIEIK